MRPERGTVESVEKLLRIKPIEMFPRDANFFYRFFCWEVDRNKLSDDPFLAKRLIPKFAGVTQNGTIKKKTTIFMDGAEVDYVIDLLTQESISLQNSERVRSYIVALRTRFSQSYKKDESLKRDVKKSAKELVKKGATRGFFRLLKSL